MQPDSQNVPPAQADVNGVEVNLSIQSNDASMSLPYSTSIKSFVPWGLSLNFLGKAVYGKQATVTYDGAKLRFSSAGITGAMIAGLTRKVEVSADYTKWKFFVVTHTGHATLELDSISGQQLYSLMQSGPYARKLAINS